MNTHDEVVNLLIFWLEENSIRVNYEMSRPGMGVIVINNSKGPRELLIYYPGEEMPREPGSVSWPIYAKTWSVIYIPYWFGRPVPMPVRLNLFDPEFFEKLKRQIFASE